jgi:hypothetical protein
VNERDPELERLFRAARREEAPTDDDRLAVRTALASRITTAAAAGAVVSLSTRVATAGIAKTTVLAWFGAGLAAGTTVGAVVTATVVYSSRSTTLEPRPTATAAASTTPPRQPSRAPELPPPPAEASAPAPADSGRPAPMTTVAPSPAPSLALETRALGDVQRELRDGRPESALRLLDAQARAFAKGALHEERAAARVIALCAAGRVAEARRARQRFLETYPQSPSADRVRASCAP